MIMAVPESGSGNSATLNPSLAQFGGQRQWLAGIIKYYRLFRPLAIILHALRQSGATGQPYE